MWVHVWNYNASWAVLVRIPDTAISPNKELSGTVLAPCSVLSGGVHPPRQPKSLNEQHSTEPITTNRGNSNTSINNKITNNKDDNNIKKPCKNKNNHNDSKNKKRKTNSKNKTLQYITTQTPHDLWQLGPLGSRGHALSPTLS